MIRYNSIFQALILSALILTCYSTFIALTIPDIDCSENIESQRKITAEKVLFNNNEVDLIVVGSSLTALLPKDYYKNRKINLSMPGGSANLGLEIIHKSRILPKVLIIETNTLYIDSDKNFIVDLFEQPYFTLKKSFPLFQTQYRPINVTLSLANQLLIGDQSKNNIDRPDPLVLERMLSAYKKRYASLPEEPEFSNTIDNFKLKVDDLVSMGTIVMFLDMPLHPALTDSVQQKYIRNKLLNFYPRDDYHWIIPSEERHYEVTDGIHLLYREGVLVNKIIDKAIGTLEKYNYIAETY